MIVRKLNKRWDLIFTTLPLGIFSRKCGHVSDEHADPFLQEIANLDKIPIGNRMLQYKGITVGTIFRDE